MTLQTDDAKIQNEISNKLIESLPTVVSGNMRSPFDLAALTAGANGGDQDFRVGGGQAGSWAVTLDGTSANTNRGGSTQWAAVNAPALEAITEFRVETNGFKAEFGRAGGGVVSFISKSGTNQYHGTVFDFIRNDAFDARGFFNATVPVYRQNDFGATVGGPVRIPKLYNGKDKTFFFFSYEGFRNRVGGSTSPIALPPPEVYTGDFTNDVSRNKDASGNYYRYTVYDPSTTTYDASINNYTRLPFPGNKIPVSRFDPFSVKMLEIAKNTLTGLRKDVVPGTPQYWLENYYQSGTSVNPNNKYSVKFDHVLNEKNRFSAYIGYNKKETVPGPTGPTGIPGIMNGFNSVSDKSPVYRGSWDHTFGPRVHNRFYFGINNFVDSNLPIAWGGGWKAKGICMPNVPNCDINLPLLGTGDFGQWGGYGYNGSENPTYSFHDDISLNMGKHFFKAGYQWEYTPYNAVGQQNVSGGANFGSGNTALPNTNYTGSGFASFLLGEANSGNVTTPRFVGMQWRYQAMYLQDDWRVRPNLTINLGLRYEFNLPTTNSGDQCADFDPTLANPGATGRLGALVFCGKGTGRIGRSTIPPGWYKGVGPRLSFSWSAASKTVIRGGFGVTYAPVKTLGGSAHFQGFAQILSFTDQTGGIAPVFKLSQGLPSYPIPPFLDPAFSNNGGADWWQGQEANRLPEPITWNLTVQREIGHGLLLEAGYAAQVGTHLVSNETDYNRINFNTLPASLNMFTAAGRNLLTTAFNNKNQLVQQAGFSLPYPQFPVSSTLVQALRPYPQYTSLATSSGGDHSGHSSYHSLVLKATRRYAAGLVVDASYVISKLLTDAESSWGNNSSAMDQYNRRLDKALSGSDRTHDVKVNYVYELPVGHGKHWLRTGILSQVIGGWRVGATQRYASGTPLGLGGAFGFPSNTINNRAYVTTFDDWRAPIKGDKFDPNVDRFFRPNTLANWVNDTPTITSQGWFPLQPRDRLGNMTRNNPKMRNFPLYSENVSLAKTFAIAEQRQLDLRFEAFNVLNRTQFGSPNTNLGDTSNFGLVNSQANTPRRMQFALKFNW
ncbi:MAG: carboxypeptidase regulatory-like domain-containing protein [Candidatus Solibacter sp.]|nr:carboxypeptidase regulatory-like domain-containing protein [Candidatus Solibacter sp.]